MSTSASPESRQGGWASFKGRAQLFPELVRSPAGRRRIQRAVHRRLLPNAPSLRDIYVESTAWRSKPTPWTTGWVPPSHARLVYLERTPPDRALVELRNQSRASDAAEHLVMDVFESVGKLTWSYPPAVDAWNLADLLHSIAGAAPDSWGRTAHPALYVAVDPYGAATVLMSRTCSAADSIVVLTATSAVEPHMIPALRYAGVVIAHDSHLPSMSAAGFANLKGFSDDDQLASALHGSWQDLVPTEPDPLLAFAPHKPLSQALVERCAEADLVIAVDGDPSLPVRPQGPGTFRDLLAKNVSAYEVLGARLSYLRRWRTLVEARDHESFFRAGLSAGLNIAYV